MLGTTTMSSNVAILPRHPLESTIRARLAHVLDMLVDAVCIVDPAGYFVYASAACEQIFGYTSKEMIGRRKLDMVHPDDREYTEQTVLAIMNGGRRDPHFENRWIRKDGSVAHILWSERWSPEDGVRIVIARDVTARKRAEAMQSALLAISEAAHTAMDLHDLFQQIHNIIGGLLPARNFFVALYDRDNDVLSFPYFVDELDDVAEPQPLGSGTLSEQVIRSGEALLLTPELSRNLPARLRRGVGPESLDWLGVPLISRDRTVGALVVQSYSGDIRYTVEDKQLLQFVSAQIAAAVERKQTETLLRHVAQHDALTNLANRKLFDERLQHALERARREQEMFALLYLDVDHFKAINDTLGHSVGDRLLHEVAQRIASCVRETDTVGRMGGDEFVVLLTGITSPHQASIVAEKILAALQWPFEMPEGPMLVTGSIGIAVYPGHADDAQQLVRAADHAMYAAKKAGGNRYWMDPPD
jgi:diguanylate cyclase (GGDEF)-like protein/PAS domain S-box-containing protein